MNLLIILGLILIIVLIVLLVPIFNLLKKKDYKNLAVYILALFVFAYGPWLFSVAALVVIVVLGFKSMK